MPSSNFKFIRIVFCLSAVLIFPYCGKPKPTVINRDFSMDPDTQMGYIYGKLIHDNLYGKKFEIALKNLKSGGTAKIEVTAYSEADKFQNYFVELKPGEWVLDKIISEAGKAIDIRSLKKTEHREFIVEKADITYTGTWAFSDSSLSVTDEKETQDHYMRINYKYVLTTNALTSLP